MSALAVLAVARDAGVEVMVDGDDLVLTARIPPPATVVQQLAQHKRELLALLRQPKVGDWCLEDWQAYFDERVAILEVDGLLPKAEADSQALEHCIVEWLRRNPAPAARTMSG